MDYSNEFNNLLQNSMWRRNKHYIGLGNPDAEILIVGKECAVNTNSDEYRYEYSQNYNLWTERNKDIGVDDVKDWIGNPMCDWSIFDPLAPYKGQLFKIERRTPKGEIISGKNGTSCTWYNYQKLINYIRELGKLNTSPNTTNIDFYKDCFITELNESCRSNNSGLSADTQKGTVDNIRKRFELMRATNYFWSHFKTVILACGPYANALRENPKLTLSIFGNAKVISNVNEKKKVPQLSFAISNALLYEIAMQV